MRVGLTIAAMLALSGCVTDVIRLDRASMMKEAGEQAGIGTYSVLAEVDVANRAKLIAIAALDPACTLPTPVLATAPRPLTGDGAVKVCIPRGSSPLPQDTALTRFDAHALGPAIATLEALSTYLGAIDAILTAKRIDVGADLDDAIGKLQGATGDIAVIGGAAPPPALSDNQREALAGALSLISTLAGEASTVAALRRLETPAMEARFDDTVARLRIVNASLSQILAQELQQQRKVLELTRASASDPRANRSEEMALIEREEEIPALETRLATSLDALRISHADYLALLRDTDAPLTNEERTRRARIAQERVLAALGALARLAGAF